jgi:glycosyltransferase involved in cell wall biosynthesis
MKILHLDPDDVDNPLSGGGPVRTLEIYRRLAARHEVTVLTPTFPGCDREVVRHGIRYIRLGRKVGDHGSSHHITFFFALPLALRRFEYDLLVEDFMPPMSVTFNPIFNRKPLVASVQWFYAETLSRQYHLPFWLGERYGLRLYRNFVVLTPQMRALVERRRPRARCEVIPNAVDDSLFGLDIAPGRFILYLGLVDFDNKGVDLLLQAYARIPGPGRLPLVIAGHGFEWGRLRAEVAALGLGGSVKVLGRVGHEERARLLAECRFACVPSRTETFGMVILEACAAGKCVVVFDRAPMNVVAAPEVCPRVAPFDVGEYANAMRVLANASDESLAARGMQCRAWAARTNWDAAAARQESFYRSVVEEEAA